MTFADYIGTTPTTGVIGLINLVLVPVIFALAFLVFIWGVIKYFIIHGGEETKRVEGRQFVLWGLIGIVVLFSVWAFVNILLSTLGISPRA
jgi:Type IV secretion system pilin